MPIRLGICGVGAFADSSISLFQHHPDVENVVLCDLNVEKLAAKCAKFGAGEAVITLGANLHPGRGRPRPPAPFKGVFPLSWLT
jgi:predicted dehydrogenase